MPGNLLQNLEAELWIRIAGPYVYFSHKPLGNSGGLLIPTLVSCRVALISPQKKTRLEINTTNEVSRACAGHLLNNNNKKS